MCSVCNKYKNKYLNIEQVNLLPDEIKQSPDNTTFTNTIERNGGIIPLLPIIGAIVAGVKALTYVADTTSSIISANRKATEDERHHRQLEDIARGGHLSSDRPFSPPVSINGIKIYEQNEQSGKPLERTMSIKRTMSDDELINKSIEFLTDK